MTGRPVRSTPAGDWFLPVDGGSGSLLRVLDGVPPDAVRRVRDLGLAGLLPIGNVVAENGNVWLRTPQPPGPALRELFDAPLSARDAVVVLTVVATVLVDLHARGLAHGRLDPCAVFLDPDGTPLVVAVDASPDGFDRDAAAVADMAGALAAAWCTGDARIAACLRRCADLARGAGPQAVLDALPGIGTGPSAERGRLARAWVAGLDAVPAPRSGDR